jgi:thiol-disulfide isomerase/thioredoxin
MHFFINIMEKHSKIKSFKNLFLSGKYLLAVFFFIQGSTIFAQGYDIKLKIADLKNSQVILGHHFGGLYYPDDTIKLDTKGMGAFKRAKPLPQGMYFFLLPSKQIVDLLMGPDQTFSFEIDTLDFVKSAKISGSLDNELFYTYMKYQKKGSMLVEKKRNSHDEAQKDSITKALDSLNKEALSFIDKVIKENKGLFFSKFLLATKDVEVPDPPKDSNGNIADSAFQYRYYKTHYFDNFDYTDASLLRTPIYEKKVKDYIEKVVPQTVDSINKELDVILNKAKPNEEVFRYLLVTFFNSYAQSQIMGFDAVFVHLSEKYYIPFATWNDKEYMDKLKKEVAKLKPTLIGNIAPNLKLVQLPAEHFIAAKSDTALKSNPYVGSYLNIHDVKAKFTVLAFWEADCSHCKKAIPELHAIYEELKDKGVQVLAVHTLSSVEGKRKWIDFVNEHSLGDWVNAWSPYSLEFRDVYDVYSTPVILVLDENKKIIAKRINPEQIKGIIEFELNRAKK